MLRDNALKFYSDHDYIIHHKPIENRQYMNENGLWAAIISETVRDRELIFNPCGFTYYEITTFENIYFGSHNLSRSHDLGNVIGNYLGNC